jgi:hypothetical protein
MRGSIAFSLWNTIVFLGCAGVAVLTFLLWWHPMQSTADTHQKT